MVLVHGQCPECQRMDVAHYGKQVNGTLAAPTTHFVLLAQGVLYRGAGLQVVWPQCLALALIGAVLFGIALVCFRKTIGTMA